jgi:hypothetical protein
MLFGGFKLLRPIFGERDLSREGDSVIFGLSSFALCTTGRQETLLASNPS